MPPSPTRPPRPAYRWRAWGLLALCVGLALVILVDLSATYLGLSDTTERQLDGVAAVATLLLLAITALIWARQQSARGHLQTLRELIESLPGGFLYFDANDRLVVCNDKLRELYPQSAHLFVRGARWEDIMRESVALGQFPEAIGREDEWLEEVRRMRHSPTSGPVLRSVVGGRHIRLWRSQLSDGSHVNYRDDITDLIATEQALVNARGDAERAHALLDAAVQALPVGFEVWDANDRLIICNDLLKANYPAVRHLLKPGVRFEDVVRESLAQGQVPVAAGKEEAWLAERLATRRALTNHVRRQRYASKWLDIHETRTPDGGIVGVRVDVTAQVNAEPVAAESLEQSRKSQSLLIEAIDALPVGFDMWDEQDRLVRFNAPLLQMYGPLADILKPGISFEEQLDASMARGLIPAALGREQAWREERLARRRAPGTSTVVGEYNGRWIETYESRTPSGYMVGVRIDVTQRVQDEETSRQAERDADYAREQLQDAIDALPDAFSLYDANDCMVLCNQAMKDLHPGLAEQMRPGVKFIELLRHAAKGGDIADARGRGDEWIVERMARHLEPGEPLMQALAGNRWVRIFERRTRSGGIAGVQINVTDMVRKEQALAAAHREAASAHALLDDVVDAMPAAVELFDQDDRLVKFNKRTSQIFPAIHDLLVPGVAFEDILRANIEREGIVIDGDREIWIAERMAKRRAGAAPSTVHTRDGVWISTYERVMSNHWTVSVRVDVTEMMEQREALTQANEELSRLARVDALTGVANRRTLINRLDTEWRRSERTAMPVAALMIDVDHFKKYNDHYGHLAGDACLQEVARGLTQCVGRASDLLARYGGEEFVMLLPNTSLEQAMVVAQRCVQTMNDLALAHVASDNADHVTISIGVSAGIADLAQPVSSLIDRADRALYEAKRTGRGRAMAETAHDSTPAATA